MPSSVCRLSSAAFRLFCLCRCLFCCLAFGMLLSCTPLPAHSASPSLTPAQSITPLCRCLCLSSELLFFCFLCRVLFYFGPRTFRLTLPTLTSTALRQRQRQRVTKTNRQASLLELCVNMLVLLAATTSWQRKYLPALRIRRVAV